MIKQRRRGGGERGWLSLLLRRLSPVRLLVILLAILSVLLFWTNLQITHQQDAAASLPNFQSANSPLAPIASPEVSRFPMEQDVTSSTGGAAACLLVMDDNHFLVEWLAYHYHVLPLRYLVIAVDPRSRTSPEVILQRWKDRTNLTIVTWNKDTDYMTTDELAQAEGHVRRYFGKHLSTELIRHRARQRMFYFKCMQHCKQQGRHWTALIDTDEYMTLSYDTIRRYGRDVIPAVQEPGSVLKFLQSELTCPDAYRNITTPCIQIPRIRFGAKTSPPELVSQEHVPASIATHHLATLTWRHHAAETNYNLNRISKTMIDVSRVSWPELQPIDSIHRPIKSLCGHRKLHIRKSEQVLVINHYLGSLEQYLYRDDARQGKERSEKEYRKVQNIDTESDDVIRPWLQGFVETMGHQEAQNLLHGAGEIQQ